KLLLLAQRPDARRHLVGGGAGSPAAHRERRVARLEKMGPRAYRRSVSRFRPMDRRHTGESHLVGGRTWPGQDQLHVPAAARFLYGRRRVVLYRADRGHVLLEIEGVVGAARSERGEACENRRPGGESGGWNQILGDEPGERPERLGVLLHRDAAFPPV